MEKLLFNCCELIFFEEKKIDNERKDGKESDKQTLNAKTTCKLRCKAKTIKADKSCTDEIGGNFNGKTARASVKKQRKKKKRIRKFSIS